MNGRCSAMLFAIAGVMCGSPCSSAAAARLPAEESERGRNQHERYELPWILVVLQQQKLHFRSDETDHKHPQQPRANALEAERRFARTVDPRRAVRASDGHPW